MILRGLSFVLVDTLFVAQVFVFSYLCYLHPRSGGVSLLCLCHLGLRAPPLWRIRWVGGSQVCEPQRCYLVPCGQMPWMHLCCSYWAPLQSREGARFSGQCCFCSLPSLGQCVGAAPQLLHLYHVSWGSRLGHRGRGTASSGTVPVLPPILPPLCIGVWTSLAC